MIAVRSWERAKGLTRIEFVAGMRALADYRRANKSAREIASLFSTGREDAPVLAARTIEENKELHRRVRTLEEIAARVEAQELLDNAEVARDELRLVVKIFAARDAESLKHLAQALMTRAKVIALLGSEEKDAVRLVFARSEDSPGDMNALMREACAMLEGRGGGKPDMAQGGGKNAEKLQDALHYAKTKITADDS